MAIREIQKLAVRCETNKSFSAPCSPCSSYDLTEEDEVEEARRVKRKRETLWWRKGKSTSDDKEEGYTTLRNLGEMLKRLDREVCIIVETAAERNTKREIKEAAGKMSGLMREIMSKRVQEALMKVNGESTQDEGTRLKISELMAENEVLREEVRRLNGGREKPEMTSELFVASNSYEEFAMAEGRIWPKGLYKRAFETRGSLLDAGKETDIILWDEEEPLGQYVVETRRRIEDKFPILREMEINDGAAVVCTSHTNSKGNKVRYERWLWKMSAGDSDREFFEAMLRVKNNMIEGERKEVCFQQIGNVNRRTKTRKMCEYIFRDTQIKCITFNVGEKRDKPKTEARRKETDGGVIVVSEEGKSYADLPESVKEKVCPGTEAAKAIRRIRESREGKMVIVLEKGKTGELAELEKQLRLLERVNIRSGCKEAYNVAYIKDIDALATREDVEEATTAVLGSGAGSWEIG